MTIPVTHPYQIICKDDGNCIIPKEVLSHEAYNMTKPGLRISGHQIKIGVWLNPGQLAPETRADYCNDV